MENQNHKSILFKDRSRAVMFHSFLHKNKNFHFATKEVYCDLLVQFSFHQVLQ